MSIKISLLNRAIKAGILSLGIFSATQAQAIVPPNYEMPVVDELPIIIDEVFLQSDANGDGQLSVDEFYQLHSAASLIEFEMTFKAMDLDQSGDVDAKEFMHFLPGKDTNFAEKQFFYASGEEGLMDLKEFIMMRIEEQGGNTDLLWKFALLDSDHNDLLTPWEFFQTPTITPHPPVLPPIKPEPIDPPIAPPAIDPEEPKEPEVDPEKPVVNPEPIETEKPEKPVENIILPVDENFTGPVKPTPISSDLIAELEERIANVKSKILRVEKSISRTQEKLENANSGKRANRLERRLKRQTLRLEKLFQRYEDLMKKLSISQQAMYG